MHSKAQYVNVVASYCQHYEANAFFVKAKRDKKLLYFEEDTAVTALLPRTLYIIYRFSIKHSFVLTKIQYTCVLEHRSQASYTIKSNGRMVPPQTCEVASGFGLFAMDRRLESGVHIDMNPGAPSFYFLFNGFISI